MCNILLYIFVLQPAIIVKTTTTGAPQKGTVVTMRPRLRPLDRTVRVHAASAPTIVR